MALTEEQADQKLRDYDRALCQVLLRIMQSVQDDPDTAVDESKISGMEWASILSTGTAMGGNIVTDAMVNKLTWNDLDELVQAYARRGIVM